LTDDLDNDVIPGAQVYRGVPVHDQQPAERIEGVVKREIDLVHGMTDVVELFEFARSSRNAPESRLFAAAKVEAAWEIAAEERRPRPTGITLETTRAVVAGLNSVYWRCPVTYGSILDAPGALAREVPLDEG
jgi:hypothetical protein